MIPETFNNKPIQKIIGLSNFKIRKKAMVEAMDTNENFLIEASVDQKIPQFAYK